MHTQAMNIALPHWDAHAIAGEPLSSLLADLRQHRTPSALGDLLMDAVTLADIYEDCDQLIALDAIIVPFKTINRKMAALMQAMKRTGTDVHPVKVDISEPFTQRGSAHVASLFTLSDGQTITVFFHNPDTTPKRIKPTDEMVSWKWLLNKKDVTITVAAEHGQDLKVQDVARRVMLLAQKNSTAFKRLNAKKSERDAVIQGLKDEVTMLEATLNQERALLEGAKAEKQERELQEAAKAEDVAKLAVKKATRKKPAKIIARKVTLATPFGYMDVYVDFNKDSTDIDYKTDAMTAFMSDANLSGISGRGNLSFKGMEDVSVVPEDARVARNATWARIAKHNNELQEAENTEDGLGKSEAVAISGNELGDVVGEDVVEPDPASTPVVDDEMPIGTPQTEDDGLSDDPNARQFAETARNYGGRAAFDAAKADGKTKLNYQQWVQVRTPAFKDWFGDWEATRILNGEPLAVLKSDDAPTGGYAAVTDWAASVFEQQGGKAVREGFGEVVLDRRAAKASLAHGGANKYKKIAFASVKDVIERGALVHETHTGDEDSFYFSAPVNIDGISNIETVLVHRDVNTRRMYLHSVTTKENLLNQRVSSADDLTPQRSGSTDSEGIAKILQDAINGKDVSKVVDAETGEPMVVYHGTNADFAEFMYTGKQKTRGSQTHWMGFFFANNPEFANRFTRGGNDGANIVPAFLSIKNMYNVSYEEAEEYDSNTAEQNDIAAQAIAENGHDGLLISLGERKHDEIVAFNPNQIKSATGNKGGFDPAKPGILDHVRGVLH